MSTKIEWTDETWPVVVGCTKCGAGCDNCYAERMSHRLACMATADWKAGRNPGHKELYRGVVNHSGHWNGTVICNEAVLDAPLHWKKPRRVFVASMADLFHPDVSFEYVARVFDVMCSWRWPNKAAQRQGDEEALIDPGHTYQVLTKRPERIVEFLGWVDNYWPGSSPLQVSREGMSGDIPRQIWVGTSVWDEDSAWTNINALQQTPAAVRFVSYEPALGPVCWSADGGLAGIDWLIVGAETGPGKRAMDPDWARAARDACVANGVAFFYKRGSDGSRLLDGRKWEQYPSTAKG